MKKQFTFAAILGLASAFSSLSASAADLLGTIMQQKVVRIAVPQDYAPYGFVGSDMQPQGIDIDTAKLIADKLGVRLQLVPVTGPNRVPYLQSGKADMTISSLGKTEERAKVIDYSIAYAPFFDAVFGKSGVKASNADELAGKTVSVTRGSMQDEELTTLAPKANVKRFEDNNSTIASFMSGQTELVAIGTSVAGALKQKNPSLDIQLKVILANAPCYVGLPKGNPALVAKVNDILRAAKADGTLDRISQTWLGAPAGDLPES
ncbi:amino acid ABC transporter substrate-binding protein (PAAT family) [Raoultella sp. BIGb0138]|uniref:transporter substrate-binding domain-containing protein n=1 Tax=Raoultella sp. BIGb0138 TaxID=2485115 RepID=UPI0010513BE6|nr:transporter substrate-binding domain-containing protein [Raoultella sp. BIGb0138]TCW12366.1 amino acid ABC transporter substrate-binding protein (PAAT family) [Raoultella sp. BIGb0138]